MTNYLTILSLLFSFVFGHSLAAYQCTGEWFYKYATVVFAISTVVVTGINIVHH